MAESSDLLQPPITTIPSPCPPPAPPPAPPPPPPPPPQPPSPPTTTSTATTAPRPSSETHPPGPTLAPKRQRRPSVRLGEIGDQPAATLASPHDSQHSRRPKYKYSKASSSVAAAAKARSLTNLVNGDSNAVDYSHETLIPDQNGGERRAVKTRRPTKRARSSWVSSSKAAEEGDTEDEGFREIDDHHPGESESPMKENSPIQSLENGAALGLCNDGGGGGDGDGVRAWLIELGLSRYAPVFEIHEVDDEVLPLLTLEDLKDMGINAVGSRRKLYTAIQKLRKGFS